MPVIADIITVLENLAPPQLAEDWDNTGLLVGRSDADVAKIMTCLTLTSDVAAEAVEQGVQLVVSHHPILFRGTKQITDAGIEGGILLKLIENGVAVYSPHTSFDSAESGINQQLAKLFGLMDVQPIRPQVDSAGLGRGRFGKVSGSLKLAEFLAGVRSAVGAGHLEFSGSRDASVSTVAVACGAAIEFLDDAVLLGCDTFVTGEARFHSVLEARAQGVNLILLGHYSSERPAIEQLATMLAVEFAEVDVWASRVECDPLAVYT